MEQLVMLEKSFGMAELLGQPWEQGLGVVAVCKPGWGSSAAPKSRWVPLVMVAGRELIAPGGMESIQGKQCWSCGGSSTSRSAPCQENQSFKAGEEEEKEEEEKKEEALMRKQFHWTEKAAVN